MQALGLIETRGLGVAIESADAMLKAADVNLLEKTYVGGGLVLIAVTGDVAAVKAAVDAGGAAVRKTNSTLLVSQHVIAHPHEDLDNVILPAITLKNREMLTVMETKTKYQEEIEVEAIEKDTSEVPVESEEIVVKDLVVKDLMNMNELPNKDAVDKMVLEYGFEEAIEVLSKFKVIELRSLARQYKNFGITGRSVSKADKRLLITNFREYYVHN